MRRRKLITFLLFVVALLSLSVIGYIFLNFGKQHAYDLYENKKYAFSLRYPVDWKLGEVTPILAVSFFSPLENNLDKFRENVNIVIQDLSENPMTLQVYSDTAIKQMEAVFGANMKILERGPAYLSGHIGYRFIYLGESDQKEYKFMHVWTIINNTAYQFTFTAMASDYNDYVGMAKKMLRSFRIGR